MEEIKTISISEQDYPILLKGIPDPPKILYYIGIMKKEEPLISVVGTRKCSLYGRQAAFDIAGKLSDAGFFIVSGLAPGIDTFSHLSAVRKNKRTIAVLGTGLDEKVVYPKENIGLMHRIVQTGGCVISEYPPQTRGAKFTFPRRNRIIAGLSYATLIIESPGTGGAMITASYALSYKRKLFALPGSIYSINSRGTHKLISAGRANIFSDASDIIKELNLPNLSFCSIKEKTES